MFSSKNIRSRRMKNSYGALTSGATDGYAKCPDMAEMRIQFRLQSAATPTDSTSSTFTELSSERDYDLLEDEVVTEDQAARMVQKWKRRRK